MTITSMRFSLATTVAIDSLSPHMFSFFIPRQVFFSQRVYPDLAEETKSFESFKSMRSGFAYHYSRHNGLQHSDNTSVLTLSSKHCIIIRRIKYSEHERETTPQACERSLKRCLFLPETSTLPDGDAVRTVLEFRARGGEEEENESGSWGVGKMWLLWGQRPRAPGRCSS